MNLVRYRGWSMRKVALRFGMVQEGSDGRLAGDTDTLIGTEEAPERASAGGCLCDHREARREKTLRTGHIPAAESGRSVRIAVFRATNTEALPLAQRTESLEASARCDAETRGNPCRGIAPMRYRALPSAGRFESVRVHAHRPVLTVGVCGGLREAACIQKRLVHCTGAAARSVPVRDDTNRSRSRVLHSLHAHTPAYTGGAPTLPRPAVQRQCTRRTIQQDPSGRMSNRSRPLNPNVQGCAQEISSVLQ